MHFKRWITAIVGLPILIILIAADARWPFYIFISIAAVLGLIEFYNLAAPGLPKPLLWINSLFVLLFFFLFSQDVLWLFPVIIALLAIFPLAFYMLKHDSSAMDRTVSLGESAMGPVYVGLPISMMVLIDKEPHGRIWIFFLLAVIFATDAGAFYFGRSLGSHKLYEAISPNKTWEGAVGGLICSLITAGIFSSLYPIHRSGSGIIILAFLLSVVSQIGDLAESMLKRCHGAKDSGKILPGHGGMLDRVDGLLFAIPVLYLFLKVFPG